MKFQTPRAPRRPPPRRMIEPDLPPGFQPRAVIAVVSDKADRARAAERARMEQARRDYAAQKSQQAAELAGSGFDRYFGLSGGGRRRRTFDARLHTRNKYGRLVSKYKSAVSKKSPWADAVKEARADLGITGFQPITKGSELYLLAREIYDQRVEGNPIIPRRKAAAKKRRPKKK